LLRPGSNQYPGVQRLQTLRALSSLPEVGSEDCLVLRCAGMARVALLCQYRPLPAGEGAYALLSFDRGGGYGWTIKSVMAPSGV